MDKVRVGIIGTGIGLRQVAPGFLNTGRAEITALSGSSIEHAKEHANGFDIGLITDDYKVVCDSDEVDIICVTTPNQFHMEQMSYALKTNKHVFLEKPVGMTADETRELAALVSNKDRLVVVGHQLRFNPYFAKIKEMIDSGMLGKPYYISINHASPWITNTKHDYIWSLDKKLGGGVRLALGVHLVDTVRYFLGSEPIAVSASMDNIFDRFTPLTGEPFDSDVSLYFSTDLNFPGCDVVLTNSAASHSGYKFDLIIRGDKGEITFDLENNAFFYKNNTTIEKIVDDKTERKYNQFNKTIFWNSFNYYADKIVETILNGKTVLEDASTMDDAIENMVILDAMMESSQKGIRIQLGDWQESQYI